MHILLTVLKIIGIVLLVLLAVLLVLLLLILFVPICYRAEGSYKDNVPYAKAQIRFLFPLLQVVFSYMDGTPEGKLKIFGICVRDFLDIERKTAAPKPEKAAKDNKNKTIESPDNKTVSKRADEKTAEKAAEKRAETSSTDSSMEHADEKKSFFGKIRYFISCLKEKFHAFVNKIEEWKKKGLDIRDKAKEISVQIKHYKEIWEMDVTQRAYKKAKKSLARLFKSIKPKKGQLKLHIGTDDPAQTGEICAFFGMIYPFVGKYVMIEPDFEQKVYEGDFYVQGHVTILALLRAAWVFLFDEDIKRLRKILTHSN